MWHCDPRRIARKENKGGRLGERDERPWGEGGGEGWVGRGNVHTRERIKNIKGRRELEGYAVPRSVKDGDDRRRGGEGLSVRGGGGEIISIVLIPYQCQGDRNLPRHPPHSLV